MIRAASGSLWSCVYLPAGTILAGSSFRLFDVPREKADRNGRVLGLTDTNMREASRFGSAYNCTGVSWLIRPVGGESDMEKLAQSFGRSAVDLIEEHGVLRWDFKQVSMDIGPLWAGPSLPQLMAIPEQETVNIVLSFGKRAPTLDLDHVVRVFVQGQFKVEMFR